LRKIPNNNKYLLVSLLLLLFSASVRSYTHNFYIGVFNQFILAFIFFVSTHYLQSNKLWKYASYFLGFATATLFVIARFFQDSLAFDIAHIIIFLIFFIITFMIEAKNVLFQERVDTNIIIGSIALFILLSLIWTFIYLLLMLVIPESFVGLQSLPWQENFPNLYYFSFITITSLGYGDITPNNPLSEFFVITEAMVGVFYMPIVVSSLINSKLKRLE